MVGTIDFDAVLELCQHEHRRIVLRTLADERRSMTVAELAEAIDDHLQGPATREVPEEAPARIRIGLHHRHLPRLETVDVVEYDDERNVVDPTADFDRVEPHISAILDAEPVIARS